MITAFPDITVTDLAADDEFLIIACDGVWNTLDSDEVVEFVRERLMRGDSTPEAILEALLDACMSPNMLGDGTGLDNESVRRRRSPASLSSTCTRDNTPLR